MTSIFLDGVSELVWTADDPKEAAMQHIGHLPFEDGLDYPGDFWDVVVPIAHGNVKIDLETVKNPRAGTWPRGETLTWPMKLTVVTE